MTENECECTSEVRASWSEQKEKRVNETGFQRQCSPDCENGLALGVQTKPAEQSDWLLNLQSYCLKLPNMHEQPMMLSCQKLKGKCQIPAFGYAVSHLNLDGIMDAGTGELLPVPLARTPASLVSLD